jgi:hypothetical protein
MIGVISNNIAENLICKSEKTGNIHIDNSL